MALIGSLFHFTHQAKAVLAVIGGVAYVLWAAGYFVGFWSATGQTPGDRVMQIRVVTASLERVRPVPWNCPLRRPDPGDAASVRWISANTLRQQAQGPRRLAGTDGRDRRPGVSIAQAIGDKRRAASDSS